MHCLSEALPEEGPQEAELHSAAMIHINTAT